jgi:surface protein
MRTWRFLFVLFNLLIALNLQAESSDDHFVITVKTTTDNETFIFYGEGGPYDIDWEGNGTFDSTNVRGILTHTYPNAGIHTIRVRGLTQLLIENQSDKTKYTTIEQWGTNAWVSFYRAFYGAENLTDNASDIPNLSEVKTMEGMFMDASSFNGNLSKWDVSTVEDMGYMFSGASFFNGDISKWNVSNVKNMDEMFRNAVSFNGDISTWDVSSVGDMDNMFKGASSFSYQNYDKILDINNGWLKNGVRDYNSFYAPPYYSLDGVPGRDKLMNEYHWEIFGDTLIDPSSTVTVNRPLPDQTTKENADFDFTFPEDTFSSANGDSLTYSATLNDDSNLPNWLSFAADTRTFSGRPSQADTGFYEIKVTADNGKGDTASDVFVLRVDNVNDAPVFTADFPDLNFAEDDSVLFVFDSIAVRISDPDNEMDDLEIEPIAIGGYHLIEGAETDDGQYIKAPPNWFGEDTLQLVVSDGALSDTSNAFIIKVTPVNDAPVISGLQETVSFRADSTVYLTLAAYASDVDNDASSLGWSFESSEDSVTAVYDSGKDTLTIEAHGDYSGGNVDLTCTVSDGELTAAAVIKLTVDPAGSLGGLPSGVPTVYALHQNYPNPFNPSTTIVYSLPKAGDVKITLYNIMGQRVGIILNGYKAAGHHEVKFDASHLASGNYFYLLESKDFRKIRKMLLLK